MKHRIFNPIKNPRVQIIREFTLEMYGYILTDDTYSKLVSGRSSVFDKLLCEYTNAKYFTASTKQRNLGRWSLENRDKTKNETEYPW